MTISIKLVKVHTTEYYLRPTVLPSLVSHVLPRSVNSTLGKLEAHHNRPDDADLPQDRLANLPPVYISPSIPPPLPIQISIAHFQIPTINKYHRNEICRPAAYSKRQLQVQLPLHHHSPPPPTTLFICYNFKTKITQSQTLPIHLTPRRAKAAKVCPGAEPAPPQRHSLKSTSERG